MNPLAELFLFLCQPLDWRVLRKKQRLHVVLAGETSVSSVRAFGRRSVAPSARPTTPWTGTVRLDLKRSQEDILSFQTSGTVQRYKTHTLRRSLRAIVDLYGVRNAPRQAHTLDCRSFSVRRVRFGRYAKKVRIVLDSCNKQPLPAFRIKQTENHIQILFTRPNQPVVRAYARNLSQTESTPVNSTISALAKPRLPPS